MTDQFKAGAVVTVQNSGSNEASNTYLIVKCQKDEVLLHHPLTDEVFIKANKEGLNKVQATLQNSTEKCLGFAKAEKNHLSYSARADLQAMIYFFVVEKTLTSKQRAELANICGKIASIKLQNNTKTACDIALRGSALLDDFLVPQFNNIVKILEQPNLIRTKTERFTIFNIAGFLLAQGE